jgi:23S rRNA (cytosine1962-C5)-methyltransferase
MIKLITPEQWKDYELLDSGSYEKLERFGQYILARPEPQACWNKSLSEEEWNKAAHVRFVREKTGTEKEGEKGRWVFLKKMPEQWQISYHYKEMRLKFRLGLTAFKHVGIFPEQAENWNYIYDTLIDSKTPKQRVLNLFAYTGGASLAARAAGAEVVHVDSVKPVVTWARENMEISGVDGIHWVVEDALKFVRREDKRGSFYNGIILDPPAYGRGPKGEKWVLEENINELMFLCSRLLEEENSFLVLNLYSMGFSSLVADNLANNYFKTPLEKEFGEIFLKDRYDKRLPLGIFYRMRSK